MIRDRERNIGMGIDKTSERKKIVTDHPGQVLCPHCVKWNRDNPDKSRRRVDWIVSTTTHRQTDGSVLRRHKCGTCHGTWTTNEAPLDQQEEEFADRLQ